MDTTTFIEFSSSIEKKNQQLPTSIMDAAVNGRYAGRIVIKILEHNSKSPEEQKMPITEKQIVRAMITDTKGNDYGLFDTVFASYADAISEKSWVEYLIKTHPSEYKVKRLIRKNLIDKNNVKQLLPYNGDLLSMIEDPSEEDMYNAIENRSSAISYIENPSVELQIFAVKKNPDAIGYIERPALEAFKAAATFKNTGVAKDDDDLLEDINVNTFLHQLTTAIEDNDVSVEDARKLLKVLIKTEPERIMELIEFGGFGPDEELQMIAARHVQEMVPRLLDEGIVPSDDVIIEYIKAGYSISRILERIERLNRRRSEKIVPPEQMFNVYLKDNLRAKTLAHALIGIDIPVSKNVFQRILELSPESIASLVEANADIEMEQIYDVAKAGKLTRDTVERMNPFLSAVQKKFGDVPSDLAVLMIKKPGDKPGAAISVFLDIKLWARSSDSRVLDDNRVYKAAIAADYRNVLLIKNPSQELRDLNYELNGFWNPIAVGDLVRVTNPRATPKYKVVGLTPDGYKLELDGENRGTFSRERIHRANGIELPKDYEQKQKLFAKKWGEENVHY
jgi:hypothetical protein